MKADALNYRTLLKDEFEAMWALIFNTPPDIPANIFEDLKTIINSGGKHLRPALVLLSAHLHGAEPGTAIPAAAAVEMLHTATLIHDDLIDNASLRRGSKTLNAHWSPAATVLTGDVVFAWAAKLVSRSQNLEMFTHFSETLEVICYGELKQMFEGRGAISTVDAYYQRIFAKTASLFALSTEAGALLAQSSEEEIAQIQRFGKLLGEAFQIVDDILDFSGDEQTLGKPIGGDLRQGLITLPVLYYAQQHPHDRRIQAVLRGKIGRAGLKTLIRDLRVSEATERAREEAKTRVAAAQSILEYYPESPYRQAMTNIATFTIQRLC